LLSDAAELTSAGPRILERAVQEMQPPARAAA
jgi:hypothetical protein